MGTEMAVGNSILVSEVFSDINSHELSRYSVTAIEVCHQCYQWIESTEACQQLHDVRVSLTKNVPSNSNVNGRGTRMVCTAS